MRFCSLCHLGKDQTVFLTEEEEKNLDIQEESDMGDRAQQAVGEDGKINWDCPCIAGLT